MNTFFNKVKQIYLERLSILKSATINDHDIEIIKHELAKCELSRWLFNEASFLYWESDKYQLILKNLIEIYTEIYNSLIRISEINNSSMFRTAIQQFGLSQIVKNNINQIETLIYKLIQNINTFESQLELDRYTIDRNDTYLIHEDEIYSNYKTLSISD